MANLKDTAFKAGTGLHEAIFKASKGRLLGKMAGMPAVMLHTKGRKSGNARTTMLTVPVVDGDTIVLVASYGGDARHPAWYLNLAADPHVEITMDGTTRPMVARVATPDEKAELWPRITEKYKAYAGYQKKTDRDIPVVIVEPPAA